MDSIKCMILVTTIYLPNHVTLSFIIERIPSYIGTIFKCFITPKVLNQQYLNEKYSFQLIVSMYATNSQSNVLFGLSLLLPSES